MDPRHAFPLRGIPEIDARADDVVEAGTQRAQAGGDLVEDVDGLARGIAGADDLARPWVAVVPLTRMRSPRRIARL
jgi:hypothetical protein